jgi:hypothetical protein
MKLQVKEERSSNFEERAMQVGLDVFEVVAVNPTSQQMSKIYGSEPKDTDKELVYVDEKDGEDRVKITFIVKGKVTDKISKVTFFLVDKERKSKDGKNQFINQVCQTAWAFDEEQLPTFFTQFQDKDKNKLADKSYRTAMEGEGDFYEFVRGVLRKVNYNSTETEVKFNFKKMLKGDFSELNSIVTDSEYADNFTAMWYVRNVETENGVKTYNEVFHKSILPPDFYNKFEKASEAYYKAKLIEIKDDEIEHENLKITIPQDELTVLDIYGYVETPMVKFKNSYESSVWDRFVKAVDGEYGCKGFYKIAPAFDYNKSMDITAQSGSLTSTDASY